MIKSRVYCFKRHTVHVRMHKNLHHKLALTYCEKVEGYYGNKFSVICNHCGVIVA